MIELLVDFPYQILDLVHEKGYQLLIFDFDGTLVDTIVDVSICFNKALAFHGFPQWDITDIKSLIGGDLETIVSRLIPEDKRSRETIDSVKSIYRSIYMASEKPNSRPYSGIKELIDELHQEDILLTVNSNKGQGLLDAMVDNIFGSDCFSKVVGYDERFPSKPDPYGVDQIITTCGVAYDQTLYIGDGKSDLITARNAGVDFCLVNWNLETP